jgi:hypothetical protein
LQTPAQQPTSSTLICKQSAVCCNEESLSAPRRIAQSAQVPLEYGPALCARALCSRALCSDI